MRTIKVTYSNGTEITTDMAAHLTDEQMLNYFAPGKPFNIGTGGNDNVQTVVKAEILN